MVDSTQTILTVSMPTLAVLIGILVSNRRLDDTARRIDDLHVDVTRQMDNLRDVLLAEFHRVEQTWSARLKHLEENR